MEKLNALVVDDSRVMRLMVMKAVRQADLAKFSFEEAENGAAALERFGEQDFDVLFVDINMPQMNGLELVQEIRASDRNADVAVVMVTSEKGIGKIEQALDEAGADAYICKPFTTDQLRRKLEGIVAKIDERRDGQKAGGGGLFARLRKG